MLARRSPLKTDCYRASEVDVIIAASIPKQTQIHIGKTAKAIKELLPLGGVEMLKGGEICVPLFESKLALRVLLRNSKNRKRITKESLDDLGRHITESTNICDGQFERCKPDNLEIAPNDLLVAPFDNHSEIGLLRAAAYRALAPLDKTATEHDEWLSLFGSELPSLPIAHVFKHPFQSGEFNTFEQDPHSYLRKKSVESGNDEYAHPVLGDPMFPELVTFTGLTVFVRRRHTSNLAQQLRDEEFRQV